MARSRGGARCGSNENPGNSVQTIDVRSMSSIICDLHINLSLFTNHNGPLAPSEFVCGLSSILELARIWYASLRYLNNHGALVISNGVNDANEVEAAVAAADRVDYFR